MAGHSAASARWQAFVRWATAPRTQNAMVALLALAPLWLAGPFPTLDGPQHHLAGYLVNHIHDPGRGFDRFLSVQLSPLSVLYDLMIAGLERLLPIRIAIKCALSVVVLLQSTGILYVIRGVDDEPSPWRWLAIAFPYSAIFYFGFDNYALALGVGLWTLGHWVRILRNAMHEREQPRQRWLELCALLFATAIAHGFAAALLGLVMGVLALGSCSLRTLPRLLLRLLAASTPALCAVALVTVGAARQQHTSVASEIPFDLAAYGWLWRNTFETPYHTVWIGNLAVIVMALTTGWAALRKDRMARGAAFAVVLLLLLVPLIPDRIEAWQKLRIRPVPLLIVLSAMGDVGALPKAPMVRHWLSRAMLAAMLVVSAHALWAHRQLADMQREFEAAIGSRPDIPLRRVCLHPPAQRPARLGGNMAQHLAVYYMIDEGGVFPSVFRGRAEAHLLAETEHFDELIPPKLAPGPPELISQRLARQALYYDDVLVWDLPQELVDTMRGDGFEVAFQRGGITRLAPPLRHIQLTVTHAPAGLLNAGVFYGELKSPHADTPLSSAHDRARSARLAPLPAREVTLVLAQARGDAWRVIQERSVDLRNHDAVVTIDLQP